MQEKVYLTKQGLKKLQKEYKRLKEIRKQKIEGGTPRVLESADLNPEFADFRDEMESLETKLNDLKYVLANYEIVKSPPAEERDKVKLGARVTVEKEGQTDRFTIVSTWESNPGAGKISDESPVGRTLLDHKVGDVVSINSPIQVEYQIKEISYE